MKNILQISYGQYSSKGVKEVNQDFHGICVPNEHQLKYKGIAIALADGISSSNVSDIASQISVNSFLEDYYCTSQTWSVKKSAMRVLSATNSWLFSQSKKSINSYDKDKGYVCTLSSMVIKSNTAHIFHIGDSRIYRIRNNKEELLTTDHRIWVSSQESYLSRAMGLDSQLTIDYEHTAVEKDDIFILASDGIYEFLDFKTIKDTLNIFDGHYDTAARVLVEKALENGSDDNLTIQIIKITNLPDKQIKEITEQLEEKKVPSLLEARQEFDGFLVLRNLTSSSRSHTYVVKDIKTSKKLVLKIPSTELQDDKAYLERFLLEDWIAKKINNPHVVKSFIQTRKQNYVYNVTEFIEGQTLTQWIIDNPNPKLEKVRDIIEQIAKGLYAFHRLEMIHQDIRPENIMIDETGLVKIIDFGATKVAGLCDISTLTEQFHIQGTAMYSAPEYFLGFEGTTKSDIFSLGIIAYQLLSGSFPYGVNVSKSNTKSLQRKLKYKSIYDEDKKNIPIWVDEAIKKACEVEPSKRYSQISEFIYDLYNPNENFLRKTKPALIQRNPLIFWQSSTLILFVLVCILLLL
jgi:protein phosphatase